MSGVITMVLGVAQILVFLLGFAIALRAFGGYRRTGSRPLLYIGTAFVLISLQPVVGFVTGFYFSARTRGYATVAADVVFFGVAFLLVLVALYRIE